MKSLTTLSLLSLLLFACAEKSTNTEENASSESPHSSENTLSSGKGSSALFTSSASLTEDTSEAAKNDYEPNDEEAEATVLPYNGIIQKHSIQEDGYGNAVDYITWQVKPGWATMVYITTDRDIDYERRRTATENFKPDRELPPQDTAKIFYYSDSLIQPMLRITQSFSDGSYPSHYRVWMKADSIGIDTTESNCEDPKSPTYSIPITLEALHGDETDQDCFKFKAQKDSTYVFHFNTLAGFVNRPYIQIQNASLQDDLVYSGDSLLVTAATSGTLTIEVRDQTGDPWYGKYRIKAETVPTLPHIFDDEYEPNSVEEPTAASPGITYKFTTNQVKMDEDAFRFKRNAGSEYIIVLSGASEAYDPKGRMDVIYESGSLDVFNDSVAILSLFESATSFDVQIKYGQNFAGSLLVTEVPQDSYEATEDIADPETFAILSTGSKMERTITRNEQDGIQISLAANKAYTLKIESPTQLRPNLDCAEEGMPDFSNEGITPGMTHTLELPAGPAQECTLVVYWEFFAPKIDEIGPYTVSLQLK